MNERDLGTATDVTTCLEIGGVASDDGKGCKICTQTGSGVDGQEESCCTTDFESGAQDCESCGVLSEEQGRTCTTLFCTGTEDPMTCNGCGGFLWAWEFESESLCFTYECKNETDCSCSGVTWESNDCGACDITDGEPFFDCSSVCGPINEMSSGMNTPDNTTSAAFVPVDTRMLVIIALVSLAGFYV